MSAGNTGYTIPTLPSRVGMKDVFIHPIGLGLRGVTNGKELCWFHNLSMYL